MQRRLEPAAIHTRYATSPLVEIAGIATAVPSFRVSQREINERAQKMFTPLARLEGLYTNTGIETRYGCMPPDWYYEHRTWEEKSQAFRTHALDLLERVAVKAVAEAGLEIGDIDVLVVNTVTGIAVPSLDAMLMNRLPFKPSLERLPIFGYGCGGGVAGLARAARLARADPGSNVLFLTVDLCTLCLRLRDQSILMFVAAALFGDGAAGIVMRASEVGGAAAAPAGALGRDAPSLARVVATGDHFWPSSEHIMGWDVKEDGFGVVLSQDLTGLMRTELEAPLKEFLERQGLTLSDVDGYLFHPGGRKVLESVEGVLGLSREDLDHSWATLRDYGNMSSATVLFVLERAIRSGARGRHLLGAFGPGFSAYFALLDL